MAFGMVRQTVGIVLLLVLHCLAETDPKPARYSCVCGPPDYLCPTAPLLQVYLTHDLYCTRFFKCTDGRAVEFQCPYGYYFDPASNNCKCDFTLCYRKDPCIQFVDDCRCCAQPFNNFGLAPQNFYVCYNDGYAVAKTCPVAFDPCTNSTIQLVFINNKCEVPPAPTTLAPPTTVPSLFETVTFTPMTMPAMTVYSPYGQF